ncbi:hypothetical protein [Actinoallomurus sp. NPDC052274]|uniref:hypothetical protein n=1 Tax=Actinoallomurus sp. NPDC052274 TaxID=3155420 RepID=UPI00342AB352
MRTIRIDDEVLACLQQHARPGDTPNQMVRRFLGLNDLPPRAYAPYAVTAALQANPGSTAAEIARAAKVGYSTAVRVLTALADDGTATRKPGERTGPDRRGNTGYRWWPAQQ